MAAQGAVLKLGPAACAISAALSLLTLSCGGGGRIAVLADPRWWAASSATVEPELKRLARERGLALDILVSSDAAVPAALLRSRPRLLLAGPLTVAPAPAIAAALPQTLVLAPGPAPDPRQENLVVLRYAPESGFEEAGRRAAAAVGTCLVGILAAPGSGAAAAFRVGFAAGGQEERLREREVAVNADRALLRRVVDELHAEGVRLFVVALRALTPMCLELLEGRGSLAVVEAQEASGAFSQLVQASVEPDWAGAVASALDRRDEAASSGAVVLPGRLAVSQRGAGGWLCGAASSTAGSAR